MKAKPMQKTEAVVPPPLPPAYLLSWVKDYGVERMIRAIEEAYAERLKKMVAVSTADIPLDRFQQDITLLKQHLARNTNG